MGTCCTQSVAAVDSNMLRARTPSYAVSTITIQSPQCVNHPSSLSMDLMLSPVHCPLDSGIIDLKVRDSDIVFGYIRQYIEPAICQYIIPAVIISVCASYYHWSFGFETIETLCDRPAVVEICGPFAQTVRTLSTRTLPVVPSTPSPASCLHCAFGHQWIPSLSGKQVTYRIKVNSFGDRSRVMIGFCSTDRLTRQSLDRLIELQQSTPFNPFDIDTLRSGLRSAVSNGEPGETLHSGLRSADSDLDSKCDSVDSVDSMDSDDDRPRGLHLVDGNGRGYSRDTVRGMLAPLQEGDVVSLDLDLKDGTLTVRNGHPALMLFTDIWRDGHTEYKLVVILGDHDSATIIDYAEIKTVP